MKKTHSILSYTIVGIGVIHIIAATQLYSKLNFNSLWFVSGGLWGILLGFINLLVGVRSEWSKHESNILLLANILSSIFIVIGVFVMHDALSALIGLVIFGTTILSVIRIIRQKRIKG